MRVALPWGAAAGFRAAQPERHAVRQMIRAGRLAACAPERSRRSGRRPVRDRINSRLTDHPPTLDSRRFASCRRLSCRRSSKAAPHWSWSTFAPIRSAPSPQSRAHACSTRRITMRCFSSTGTRRSCSSATTVFAASMPPRTSGSTVPEPLQPARRHRRVVSARRSAGASILKPVQALRPGRYPAAHRLRGAVVHRPGAEPDLDAADSRKRSARHVRALPGRPAGVAADRPDRLCRRHRRPRASRVRRDAIRRRRREPAGVRAASRGAAAGSALPGPQSHDAARCAVGGLGVGRRAKSCGGTKCRESPAALELVPERVGRDRSWDTKASHMTRHTC